MISLNRFVREVREAISDRDFAFVRPSIYPRVKDPRKRLHLKEGEKNTCRPICLFSLKDRLILTFTNRFLTQLLDPYFEDNSFAFRAVKTIEGNEKLRTHHDAIRRILDFKANAQDHTYLWIAERDIEKFYDSVNHQVIRTRLATLIDQAKKDYPELILDEAINIFEAYLKCYSFNHDVLPLNGDANYWEIYKISNGEFGWVRTRLEETNYYSDIEREQIGIPQGGALSGLIANVVLDAADKAMLRWPDLLYTRFCDDMIMIHCDEKVCAEAILEYEKSLKSLKLVPHSVKDSADLTRMRTKTRRHLPAISLEPFWNAKSKGPYKWGPVNENAFPWIGFVGYEISYDGYVRVRKGSIQKQVEKQKRVVVEIKKAIKQGKRVSNGTIAQSAIRRLIGMSVGRVELWNYDDVQNELCWKSGFKELTSNKYSKRQMKMLDRSRNKLYYRLLRDLEKKGDIDDRRKKRKGSRQIVKYDKPFSYYHQVIERAEVGKPTTRQDSNRD